MTKPFSKSELVGRKGKSWLTKLQDIIMINTQINYTNRPLYQIFPETLTLSWLQLINLQLSRKKWGMMNVVWCCV